MGFKKWNSLNICAQVPDRDSDSSPSICSVCLWMLQKTTLSSLASPCHFSLLIFQESRYGRAKNRACQRHCWYWKFSVNLGSWMTFHRYIHSCHQLISTLLCPLCCRLCCKYSNPLAVDLWQVLLETLYISRLSSNSPSALRFLQYATICFFAWTYCIKELVWYQ